MPELPRSARSTHARPKRESLGKVSQIKIVKHVHFRPGKPVMLFKEQPGNRVTSMAKPGISTNASEEIGREGLVQSIRAIMKHITALHCQEIEALKKADIGAIEQIDDDLVKANAHRDWLLDKLKTP